MDRATIDTLSGTFFGCCASAITPRASNTNARIDSTLPLTRHSTPQPSSLRTSFRALCITRIEIKESVIYTAEGDRDSSSRKSRFGLRLN